MQESIYKMREALRREHENSEQQNLVRIGENLELTRDLNHVRKKNAALEAVIVRLEADIKVFLHVYAVVVARAVGWIYTLITLTARFDG